MENNVAKNHVTFVGALHIGFGALAIVSAVIIIFLLGFAKSYIPEIEKVPVQLIEFLQVFIPTIIIIFGLLDMVAGLLLFSYKPGARMLVLIISAINCLNIPIGTLKGVYSIWVLMLPEVIEMFNPRK